MKFAQTFIKHHVMTILLYILVVVFGFYSFQNLPLALMPSMEVPAGYRAAGNQKTRGCGSGSVRSGYAPVHLVREYGYAGHPVYE